MNRHTRTTRRAFVAGSAAAPAAPALLQRRKPNVLFIVSDQWSPLASDLSGRSVMPRTPAADSIAGSGIRFGSAYCTWPLCSPSRSSLFSGRMPHETGLTGNVRRPGIVPDSVPALGELFARAGYTTGYFGKEHTGGFAYRGFQHLGTHQYPGAGYLADGAALDSVFTRDTIDFIGANRQSPFLAVLSLINPHDICYTPSHARIAGKSFVDVHQAFRKNDPKYLRNLDFPPPRPNLNPTPPEQMVRVSANQQNWTEHDWRLYLATYFLLIENTDWLIGLAVDALRRNQLERDTIVLFTADHGDQMGAHHLVGKNVMYDECMRVPLAISWPGQIKAGQVNEHALVSGADVLPTLCELAGLPVPTGTSGRSVRPLIAAPHASWRDYLVAELNDARMVRTAAEKYIVYQRAQQTAEFLYDLHNDPGETRNLAAEPSAQDNLQRGRSSLTAWMKETGGTFDRTPRLT
jgi:arylsulfatase A-like enzyme